MAERVIFKNWQDFLRVNSNKTELFNFLTKALLVTYNQDGKQFVITEGDPDSLSPCTHEEADNRLLFYANHVVLRVHLLIRMVDTDIFILVVSVAPTLGPEYI